MMNRRDVLKTLGWLGVVSSLPVSAIAQASAPAAPKQNSRIYRFPLGNFEGLVISDGAATLPPRPIFAPEASDAEVTAVLKEYFLPTDQLGMNFNVLLIDTGKEKILVDSGYGTGAGSNAGKLQDGLKEAGISPDQITAVCLSHCHPDHMGGLLNDSGKAVFSKAQHYVSAEEWDFWTGSNPDLSQMLAAKGSEKVFIDNAQKHLKTLEAQFVRVKAGSKLPDGVALELVPGHTPGHSLFRFTSGKEELLHIVDLAHHEVLMFAKPDWTVLFDTKPRQASETRKTVFAKSAAQGTRVFGYHLPFPGLGHVQKSGDAYRWLPEGWNWS